MQRTRATVLGVAALLALVAVGAVAGGLGTVGAHDPASPADRTIAVSATGEASAAPDRALVHVEVAAEGDDPAAVRDELATGADDLRAALDGLDVDYETTGYSIEETHRSRKEPDVADYRGSHRFEVTVGDTDDVGRVVDAAAEAGAQVQGVRLTLSADRRLDLRETAIENAMGDARAQADAIARSGGLSVTNVATVEATQDRFRPVPYETAGGDGGGGPPAPTSDEGSVSVAYDVRVTYNATAS